MFIDNFILCLLSYYPCTGYDIRSESSDPGMARMIGEISYGSIYPRLQKLRKEGFVHTLTEEKDGRQRKVYDLTDKGWERLNRWLEEAPQTPVYRDEILLKIMALGSTRPADRGLLIRHLQRRKEKTEKLADHFREWPVNGVSTIDEFGMMNINLARMQMETELKWIDQTIEQLQGPPQPPAQNPVGMLERIQERRSRHLSRK